MAAAKFSIIVRALSTSNAAQQMVKPPVQVFGVGGRYATALYSAAVKAKEIDVIEKELDGFQKAMNDDKNFRTFIRDPTIKRSIKANALKIAGEKFKISNTTKNTLLLIAENGRLKDFDQIFNAFKCIMAAHRGEISCEIVSAEPLDQESLKEIETALMSYAKGKKILITTVVDPNILGGLIINIGDNYLDMSIASKLKKYTEIISSPL